MGENQPPSEEPKPAAAGASPFHRTLVRVLAAIAIIVVAVGSYYWWWAPKPTPQRPPLPNLADLNEDSEDFGELHNPGFVGAQACAPCHNARVAEFAKTPHALACRRPLDGPMPPGFEQGRNSYVTGEPGLRFNMTRENGEFFLSGRQDTPSGEQRSKSRIDLVYGANKADEVFFSWRGDRLYEHMLVWLHPSNEWANTPYNPHGGGEFVREATTRCMECHNTWFEHVSGTPNEYKRESFILGVSCEKCHGPGKTHVDFHRIHPKSEAPHAIIHPGHLSRERRIEVCTQCHGNSTKSRGPIHRYRPGEPLEEYYRTAQTKYPEEDHVANQVKYLRQSKCFQNSKTLNCITCHDPHRPHDPADAAAARKSCLQCHQPEACNDRPNLPTAVRDDCIGCHMPKRVWMNVHFHTAEDRYFPPIRRYEHRIGKHPVARSEVLLAWHRTQTTEASRNEAAKLNHELHDYWLAQVDNRRRDFRFLAAVGAARESLRLDLSPQDRDQSLAALKSAIDVQSKLDADLVEALRATTERRYSDAIDILNKMLVVKPDFAVVHSKLGTLYSTTGRIEKAIEHLEAVARHDPDNAAGLGMLGWLAFLSGRSKESAEFYRRADEIEPFDARINYPWALALLQSSDATQATERFRHVLAIDPKHIAAYQGLAEALRQQGKPGEAVRYAWRAAKLTGFQEPKVLVNLADAYADAGRVPEAAAAATKALELDADAARESRLDFATRRRMEEIRTRAGQ
jgi:tetratricopeptide (TPR) repeat protein